MIHIILGTKAQLIKMAPVMVALTEKNIPYHFISTGQHQSTMQEILNDFKIKPPDLVLYNGPDIVSLKRIAAWFTRICITALLQRKKIFRSDLKGIVLVHGDTLSTLLGAIMGRIAGLRVGHIESGLRSFHVFHPFPEEVTRRIVFRLSHILFCPGEITAHNVAELKKQIVNTHANTMVDTLKFALNHKRRYDHVPTKPYGLVSIHRYENIFRRQQFENILLILEKAAQLHRLVFIMHPPTEKQLLYYGLMPRLKKNRAIELRQRYSYFDFLSMLEKAEFVITDGGSLQEETSYLGLPCLLLRKATERVEGLEKNVVLSRYNKDVINNFLTNYQQFRKDSSIKVDKPSEHIVRAIKEYA